MHRARHLWSLFEPLHAVTYFAPQAREAFEAAGLRGFWRSYFAGRSAPLGPVGAAPVTALFYGFAPSMVARALPSVWQLAVPDAVLEARRAGAAEALLAAFAGVGTDGLTADRIAAAADLARSAALAAETGGRALGAANSALPWPDEPVDVLWHAATVLREVRGDGHVAALLTSGLTGLEALVLRGGSDLDRGLLQPARGWTDQEWDAARAELTRRGLLDDAGRITVAGRQLHEDVETITDHLAVQPWTALGPAAADRFVELVSPLARAAAATLPASNPIGLPVLPVRAAVAAEVVP
jgi:Helix-turn-helix family